MRFTLLNQFYAPDISPTAQLAASLAEHRAAKGDEVTVVTGKAGYLEGLAPAGNLKSGPRLQVRRVWTPDVGKSTILRRLGGYVAFLLGSLARVVSLPRQDVIVAMTTPPYVMLVALAHKALHPRTRVVLWSMDCYPDAAERLGELPPGGLVARSLKRVNRWAFRRLDGIIALDVAMARLIGAYLPEQAAQRVVVVPNWEQAADFPAGAPAARWTGYDDLDTRERTVVLYLGNTGYGHRFDAVLDAAEELADEAVFLFVGGGARWESLDAEVRARHLETSVVLRGYVPKEETAAVMAGADLALVTLDDRSLGIMSPSKLHSNLAAGLPVLYVGPTGSNVDEAIERFGCGTSLRNGDADGVAAAVRAVRSDPEAHAALRKAARAAFDEAYSDERALPLLDAVLDG